MDDLISMNKAGSRVITLTRILIKIVSLMRLNITVENGNNGCSGYLKALQWK